MVTNFGNGAPVQKLRDKKIQTGEDVYDITKDFQKYLLIRRWSW